ncbi:IclR family transcriptional regulator [Variovorax dokdonensis]
MAFSPGDRELTASDLLKRVNLSRPTLYRLLRTLENKGFILSSGDPQRFALGASVAQLAHVWGMGLDIAAVAGPALRRLWEETGETVALLVHEGRDRLCVAELPSVQPLSFKRGVGHREHVAKGASGRVILANLTSPDVYVQDGVDASTDLEKLHKRLQTVREQGYEVSRDELIKGAVAVAVPVFLGDGNVIGSLAVFGPGVRVDEARVKQFVEQLKVESRKLSQALGQR